MAIITEFINNIRKAIYGKDVRESIASSIEKINEEVESTTNKETVLEETFNQLIINAGNSNAEIVAARTDSSGNSFDTIGDRIQKNYDDLKNAADTTNTNVQSNTENIQSNTKDIDNLKSKTESVTSSVNLAYNVSLIEGQENTIEKKDGYVKLDFGVYSTNKGNDWVDGKLIFTLPVGFRPKHRQLVPIFTTRNGSAYKSCVYYLDIYVNGEAHLQLCNGDTTAIYSAYIQNIEFLAATTD